MPSQRILLSALAVVLTLMLPTATEAGECDITLPVSLPFGLNPNVPNTDNFGNTLDVDDTTAVVGEHIWGNGRVYLYEFNEGNSQWSLTQQISSPGAARFGTSVELSGDTMVVGASGLSGIGLAYVYERTEGVWTLSSTLTATTNDANDQFGAGVAIEGTTVVAGAFLADVQSPGTASGAAYVYERPPGGWPTTMTETATLLATPGDFQAGMAFGRSVSISNGAIVVAAPIAHVGVNTNVGALYVYENDGSGWTGVVETPAAKLTVTAMQDDLNLGGNYSLDMWNDDIVAGAPIYDLDDGLNIHVRAGAAFVWSRPPGGWVDATEDAILTALPAANEAGNLPSMGYSVAIDDGIVLAGATWADVINPGVDQGAVYMFVRPSTGWEDLEYSEVLTATDFSIFAPGIRYGNDVSISGTLALIGAPRMFTTSGEIGGAYPYDIGDCTVDPLPGVSVWQITGDCVFSNDANWFPATPSSVDNALLEQSGSFDLCLTESATIGSLSSVLGNAQLDLAGWTLDLSGEGILGDALAIEGTNIDPVTLLITGTGMVRAESEVRISADPISVGTLTVDGNGTALIADDENLTIGQAGAGTLTITNGAMVLSESAAIGLLPGSDGVLTVAGPGSVLQADNFILVPFGRIEVFDEGLVDLVSPFGAIFVESEAQLVGDGIINGNVVVSGDLAPGGDGVAAGAGTIGTLTIEGGLDQKGRLLVEVDADTGASDIVELTGPAYLAGGLVVQNVGSPDPGGNLDYTLLTAPQITGVFDVALLPGLAGSQFMRVDYGGAGPGGGVGLIVDDLGELFGGFDDPESLSFGGLPSGALLANLDADAFPDLAIAIPDLDPMNNGTVVVLLNNGTDVDGTWLGFGVTIQVTVGREPSGITAGQLNADGMLDLAVSNSLDDSVTVLLNDIGGGGNFNTMTLEDVGAEPLAIAAGDFTENGNDDLAVALGGADTVVVLENDGGSNFAQSLVIATGSRPCSMEPEDLDNDKDRDLVIGNCLGASITVAHFEQAMAPVVIELPVGAGPEALATADLDQNGFADIFTANRADGTISVVLNDGGLTYRPSVDLPVGGDPRSLTGIDLEGDGDIDVALVADDELGNSVVQVLRNDLNNGEQLAFAAVEDLVAGTDPVFVLEGDLDQDETSDLVAVNDSDGAAPGPPQGSVNSFVNATGTAPPCPGDLDGSGDVAFPDLLALLAAWGPCAGCPQDIDGDDVVGFNDLLLVLATWGSCS